MSSSSSSQPQHQQHHASSVSSSSSSTARRATHHQYYYRKQSSSLDVVLFVPNVLGYLRIVLALVSLHTACCSNSNNNNHNRQLQRPITTVVLWVISSSLDLFDGILARKLRQTSTLGIYIDIAADNFLRTAVWLAAAFVSSSTSTSSSSSSSSSTSSLSFSVNSSSSSSSLRLLIPAWIISLEWCTMICTQIQARRAAIAISTRSHHTHHHTHHHHTHTQQQQQQHWKEQQQQQVDHPWWIRQLFRNNFRNPLGIWAIYGLFAANMFWYASHYYYDDDDLYYYVPWFHVWKYLAYTGRVLSMSCELYLISKFVTTSLRSHVSSSSSVSSSSDDDKENDNNDKREKDD